MTGKPELMLAYKMGALFVLNNLRELIEGDPGVKERMEEAVDASFEEWHTAIAPLLAIVGRG